VRVWSAVCIVFIIESKIFDCVKTETYATTCPRSSREVSVFTPKVVKYWCSGVGGNKYFYVLVPKGNVFIEFIASFPVVVRLKDGFKGRDTYGEVVMFLSLLKHCSD